MFVTLNTLIRVLRRSVGKASTRISTDIFKRERTYLNKVERHAARLSRNDLEPLVAELGQTHNLPYFEYKWHEHLPSISIYLPDAPESLRILATLYATQKYPKSEKLEEIVKTFEPPMPADIHAAIRQSQGLDPQQTKPPQAQQTST